MIPRTGAGTVHVLVPVVLVLPDISQERRFDGWSCKCVHELEMEAWP